MLWPGTLIGAGGGFLIASIPGAMLGALLGQALDRRLQLHSWAHLRERLGGRAVLRNDELLFVLLGRLAKSGGRVVDKHIEQARQEMRLLDMSAPAQKRAIGAFNRGKSGNESLRGYLRRLKSQPHAAEGVLRACWRMIIADGRVDTRERELIVRWGRWLGWTPQQIQALGADYEPQKGRWQRVAARIKSRSSCWASPTRVIRRRSSAPIDVCSAVITRTRWQAPVQAPPKCLRRPRRPASCITLTR